MNQEKKHPTLEEILAEDKAAKRLRLRKLAAIFVLLVPVIIIGLIWASGFLPSFGSQFFGTGFVVIVTGIIAAMFATEFGETLPF